MTIQLLDPIVAAQINAGPVAERPASVVKELLENALDAQATRIQIDSQGAGLREIRISDNGTGIPSTQLSLAFSRQATSKLRHTKDLWSLQTLGFRGEALASIASIAQVTCITRTAQEPHATEFRIAGGQLQATQATSSNIGTSITIQNLFYNAPQYRSFLRSDSAEQQAITAIVSQYALAYPEVQFQLSHNQRTLLHTSGNGLLLDTIIELYGPQVGRNMLALQSQASNAIQISGYISAPGTTRSQRNHLHIFVNRRAITSRGLIASIIEQAYHTLLQSGQHPLGVINLQLDPALVDINIHPNKTQVRFRDPNHIYATLSHCISNTLKAQASWAEPATITNHTPTIGLPTAHKTSAPHIIGPQTSTHNQGIPKPSAIPQPPNLQQRLQLAPISTQQLPLLKVIGQFEQRYIVAESADGLYLINQQAAIERILYHQLSQGQGSQTIAYTLSLPPITYDLASSHQAQFQAWGIEFQAHSESLHLTTVPFGLSPEFIPHLFTLLLDHLAHHPEQSHVPLLDILGQASLHPNQALTQTLSTLQMQHLIQQLEQCQQADTCPHGYRTFIHWGQQHIMQHFGSNTLVAS